MRHNMRELDQYQVAAMRTAVYSEPGTGALNGVFYTSFGLVGEAGELANQVKKILRDDNATLTEERRQKIVDELGDCLWYVAALARELGVNLSELATLNLAKLSVRDKEGTLHGDARK
jgi:NTP pyrophosphatase (non-canonical NTP hydrolase)